MKKNRKVAASFEIAIGVEWMIGSWGEKEWGTDEQNQVYIPIHLNQWMREKKAGKKIIKPTKSIRTEERLERYVATALGEGREAWSGQKRQEEKA